MELGDKLAEGKTKIIYAHPQETSLAVMVQKDAISAGDGARRNTIEGKGALSGRTSANVFGLLKRQGVPTHFISAPADDQMVVVRCEMIPLEVVMRGCATGSYLKRHPESDEGQVFDPVLVEFFVKDDARHDPQMQPDEIVQAGLRLKMNSELMTQNWSRGIWRAGAMPGPTQDIQLVDLKIEFGRTAEWHAGCC